MELIRWRRRRGDSGRFNTSARTVSWPDSLASITLSLPLHFLCNRRHFLSNHRDTARVSATWTTMPSGRRRERVRQPACEPCRTSKLACDHGQPTCSRCSDAGKANLCTYRGDAFARRPTRKNARPSSFRPREDSSLQETPTYLTGRSLPSSGAPAPKHAYPNPGYLGPSSHKSIFDSLPTYANDSVSGETLAKSDDHILVRDSVETLRMLLEIGPLDRLVSLVDVWLSRGSNLSLAGPLVQSCSHSASEILTSRPADDNTLIHRAKLLLENSSKPLEFERGSRFDDFCNQTSGPNTRWETMGLFLLAVCRATYDILYFNGLYDLEQQARSVRESAMKTANRCLEICHQLDCLNDISLILQYESWIVHSWVRGDESEPPTPTASRVHNLTHDHRSPLLATSRRCN